MTFSSPSLRGARSYYSTSLFHLLNHSLFAAFAAVAVAVSHSYILTFQLPHSLIACIYCSGWLVGCSIEKIIISHQLMLNFHRKCLFLGFPTGKVAQIFTNLRRIFFLQHLKCPVHRFRAGGVETFRKKSSSTEGPKVRKHSRTHPLSHTKVFRGTLARGKKKKSEKNRKILHVARLSERKIRKTRPLAGNAPATGSRPFPAELHTRSGRKTAIFCTTLS